MGFRGPAALLERGVRRSGRSQFAEILLVRRGPCADAFENLMVARAHVLLRDTG